MNDLLVLKNNDELDEYINELVNIFRLSSKDKYIILNMSIDNNLCKVSTSVYNELGISMEYDDKYIECNEYFYNTFLTILVNDFKQFCYVSNTDIVNLNKDNFVTFRMITDNNDLFTIDGLTSEYANRLLLGEDFKNDDDNDADNLLLNNNGNSNILGIVLILGLIAFCTTGIFLIFK